MLAGLRNPYGTQMLNLYYNSHIHAWHEDRVMHGISAHLVSMTITLMQGHNGSGKGKTSVLKELLILDN